MQSTNTPNRRRDLLLVIFSILGILVLMGRGAYLAFRGAAPSASSEDLPSAIIAAVSMAFCAALLLPMLIYSLRHLRGQEVRPAKLPPVKFWQIIVLVSAWLVSLATASFAPVLLTGGWIVAIPFLLLGIAIPVATFVWIAAGGLMRGSVRRLWSVFGVGMAGSTLAAMLLEYLVVGIGVLVAGIFAVADPSFRSVIFQLRDQLTSAQDMQVILTTLAPYLTNPLIFLLVLAFGAVLAPLIEEALKPAVVWLMGKRLRSPAEGFALGALCGAGFATLEGITAASSQVSLTFGVGVAARAASTLMHITASGLMGWGIASAQLEKRYGRLALTYFLSVTLHALWNGSALLAVYGSLRFSLQGVTNLDVVGMLSVLAGVALLGVTLITILVLLPLINHRLRVVRVARDDIIPPPQP